MLDHSIEELREFVNNYKLNNNPEAHTTNKTTRQYSNEELIKLLESDAFALNMDEKQETEKCTEKAAGNDSESQKNFNVLKVKEYGIKGLTVEVRENLYSKFNTALSINYKTIFSNQNRTLTDANICDIAKKIEFSILSIATDLNSYKLSGAEKVVNIEKQTCNRNLCEALRAEMELLKLRDQIRTAESKDNPQEPSNVLTAEAETISHEKVQCRVDKSKKSIPVYAGNGKSLDIPILNKLANESDEFYSCSSGGRSPTESQLNNKSCAPNSNTQDPVVNVSEEKSLKETEPAVVEDCKCVSTTESFSECNNNYGEKNIIEIGNVLSEINSNNNKDEFHLASTEGALLSKKRKRKSQSDEESNIEDNKENTDFMNQIANTLTENSPPSKKLKTVAYEMTVDSPDSPTSDEGTPPLVTSPLFESESSDMEYERFSPLPADMTCTSDSKKNISLENSLSNEIPHGKCNSLGSNKNVISPGVKIELQADVIKPETISQGQSGDGVGTASRRLKPTTTNVKELLSPSTTMGDKKNHHQQVGDIILKKENVSSVDVDSSNILNDNTVLQKLELKSENDGLSSLDTCTRQDTEITAIGGNKVSDVDANNDHRENHVVFERTCLIEEEIFELERARLDRECEEIKKQNEEMKKRAEENEDRDFIYGDHQRIFEIIIPIIREYYPSDYIPEEWSYGKILQRLQIDLAEAEMSDEEMASYTRDSIKTMRYLCDHCIVQ